MPDSMDNFIRLLIYFFFIDSSSEIYKKITPYTGLMKNIKCIKGYRDKKSDSMNTLTRYANYIISLSIESEKMA